MARDTRHDVPRMAAPHGSLHFDYERAPLSIATELRMTRVAQWWNKNNECRFAL